MPQGRNSKTSFSVQASHAVVDVHLLFAISLFIRTRVNKTWCFKSPTGHNGIGSRKRFVLKYILFVDKE